MIRHTAAPLGVLLVLALVGCEGPKPSPLARHATHDIGDPPGLRYSELDDGTAFVVIGKHTQTEHMIVLIRRVGSTAWEPIRGAEVPPAVVRQIGGAP